jgi:flagellar hook protein FlgE
MSFDIALSGINAINTELDTISNNIANVNTTGFKSSRANFAAMYAALQPTGTQVTSLSQSIALGGNAVSTGDAMNAAISGSGFFVAKDTSGAQIYTRAGVFSQNSDGYIVDSFGHKIQGYGAVTGSTALGALGDLQVPTGQIAAQPSTKLAYVANLSADWSAPTTAIFNPADATSYNSSTVSVVYDSLGVQHSLTQYFVKSGTDTNTVHYTMDGAALPATTALTFNTVGALLTPAAAVTVALGTPTGAAALSVNINYNGTTQFSGDAAASTNAADGYASGALTGVKLSADGAVMAQYSNGQTQSVGTVALATFPDENGLVPISDTAWSASIASGTALYYTPGTATAGTLTIGSIEQSNVNLTSQLVDLMSAQNNYQANSKVLQTQSQMLQTLIQAV